MLKDNGFTLSRYDTLARIIRTTPKEIHNTFTIGLEIWVGDSSLYITGILVDSVYKRYNRSNTPQRLYATPVPP